MRWTELIWPAIGFLVAGLAIAIFAKWDIALSRAVLERWAIHEGLELMQCKHRALFCGPFTWNRQKSDAVYLIKARDSKGAVRSAWVRLGTKTAVRWLS